MQPDQPIAPPTPPLSPPPSHAQGSVGMWDAFEHILMFISMYVFASSSSMLLHTFVDTWLPNASAISNMLYNSYSEFGSTLVRGYLAAIIVSFPIFAFLFIRITKHTKLNPAVRNLELRKILIYLTLTATFIILIWKLINVVYTLLSGNIGINFLMHFIITVSISGLIFTYYFLQVKDDRQPHTMQ